MAKKGIKAPSRSCEKCGKPYHPRKGTCPACGAANPTARKKGVSKNAATGNTRPRSGPPRDRAAVVNGTALKAAIQFVQDAGSFEIAKAALEEIETVRNL